MRPGFWEAPAGIDADMATQQATIQPIGLDPLSFDKHSVTSSGAIAALARIDGAALARACPQAMALLPELAAQLKRQRADAPSRAFGLDSFSAAELKLIADVFGEGEVSGVVALPRGATAQIQESTMAGLWRISLDEGDGTPARDYVEVGAIPQVVSLAAQELTLPPQGRIASAPPEGAMNVMPVLAEIADRATLYRPGTANHVVNFTLFPMSPVDMAFLQQTLGNGPIQLLSRGYGTCRVLATGMRHVWSVQFFNAMDTIILDTLEIGDIPAVAIAANEDFEDSAERLSQIIEAYLT